MSAVSAARGFLVGKRLLHTFHPLDDFCRTCGHFYGTYAEERGSLWAMNEEHAQRLAATGCFVVCSELPRGA